MPFDNLYLNRKDHRTRYHTRDSRSIDRTCRNHGSCGWCTKKRLYRRIKEYQAALSQQTEYENYEEIIEHP